MKKGICLGVMIFAVAASTFAQGSRQAVIRGGGGPDQGKCTIEVVVDAGADIQVQGSTATLRTTAGQAAQWRRFECSSPMPANPPNFHFAGVDGRGRQDLIRDPRNGGAAVVHIEDSDGGSEGYTFDLTWGQDQGFFPQGSAPQRGYDPSPGGYRDYSDDRYRPGYRNSDYYRRYGHGFAYEDAIATCRQSVLTQASRRFPRNADVHIGRTDIDDNPGRNDWVIGSLDVHRGRIRERYNFSCSVNFDLGRVRSAQIDAQPLRY